MARNKTDRGRRRIWRFYPVYFSAVGLTLLLLFAALAVVRSRLREYENAQPKYVAQQAFERYFAPADYDLLLSEARYEPGKAEEDEIKDYLAQTLEGRELTYAESSSDRQDELKYLVKAGEKQVAAIALRLSAQKTPHGYSTYEFAYLELYLQDLQVVRYTVTVEAPVSYKVTVDGVPLSADALTDTYPRKDVRSGWPEDLEGVPYAVYTLEDLRQMPSKVSAVNQDGAAAQVAFTEETCTYTAGLVWEEALKEEYGEFVIQAMEKYAAYMQAAENVSLSSLKKYFDPDSDAYAAVIAAGRDRWMVLDWTGIDFEDVEAGEFYTHSPDIFSCRVSLTQLLHRSGQDYSDTVDMYLFLHRTDRGYQIYDWFKVQD